MCVCVRGKKQYRAYCWARHCGSRSWETLRYRASPPQIQALQKLDNIIRWSYAHEEREEKNADEAEQARGRERESERVHGKLGRRAERQHLPAVIRWHSTNVKVSISLNGLKKKEKKINRRPGLLWRLQFLKAGQVLLGALLNCVCLLLYIASEAQAQAHNIHACSLYCLFCVSSFVLLSSAPE
jgi:hypothetical protein